MKAWNKALLAACDSYPNMRIYDWASDVKDSGSSPTASTSRRPGYRIRARLIAEALLEAFPAEGGPSEDCIIHPTLPAEPRVAPTGPSGPTGPRETPEAPLTPAGSAAETLRNPSSHRGDVTFLSLSDNNVT